MNANLQRLTQTSIKHWQKVATTKLVACGISSARLDAELILSHALNKNRTYLHAHPENILNQDVIKRANMDLERRLSRVPIAYIIGKKEFYGREFIVSPATLIPRPESEEIIDNLKKLFIANKLNLERPLKLVDVGTGCGVLGITAKIEFPEIDVTLTDISLKALEIAQKNADRMNVSVDIINGDLLENYNFVPDIILANLPYVDTDWDRSPETSHEPASALFADYNGEKIIKKLLSEASQRLKSGGFVIIESDPCQHDSLSEFANKLAMQIFIKSGYVIVIQKV